MVMVIIESLSEIVKSIYYAFEPFFKIVKKYVSMFLDLIVPLIPVLLTPIIPISIYKIFMPFMFRPDTFGSVPWFKPSFIVENIVYLLFLSIIIYILGIISCILITLQKCKKIFWGTSAKYATLVLSWLWLGIILNNTLFLPFGKAYLLSFIQIPYSLYFVDGIMLTPFVFLGTIMARSNTLYNSRNECNYS
jgi:hypothetical protein